ncbi:CatB-related O-acetyltransferase [Sinorhizobium sp. Sb3]|uniref:CatB-related O-acetyltransferase n=1 Tax=Sinorhizobium sp. Sb3 TaxID=1358417 RepID=UPI000B28E552|nr:CatB-related O-acetyltransferase [Sinorhizobium sp. Sb3]
MSSTIAKSAHIDTRTVLEDPVHIGPNCTVMADRLGRYCFVNAGTCIFDEVNIGRFTTFARNCQIGGSEHPIHYLSTSFFGISRNWFPDDPVAQSAHLTVLSKPAERARETAIKIGSDVWFGTGSIVLKGVTIADGAVVGAGAIVTKDIPPYAVAVGNPARVIKYRFCDATIRRLLASKWWDMEPVFIASLPLNDVQKCLDILEKLPPVS